MLFILVFTLALAIMQQQDKSLNGYRMLGVLTNSMVSPDNSIKDGGFRSGDILITKEMKPQEIKVGDVITFETSANPTKKNSNYLTHRVVNISDSLGEESGIFFTTRGDANKSDDLPINSSSMIGKGVFVIPKIGMLLIYINENKIVSLIFVLSLLGFIWVMKAYIFSPYSNSKTSMSGKNRRPKGTKKSGQLKKNSKRPNKSKSG